MNLKIYHSGKIMQGQVLIGKTGQLRFKKQTIEAAGLKPDQRIMIGTDETERPAKSMYLITNQTENNGFKLQYQNKSYFISIISVIKDLGLKIPIQCDIEPYEDEKYKGFKVIFPKRN